MNLGFQCRVRDKTKLLLHNCLRVVASYMTRSVDGVILNNSKLNPYTFSSR